MNSQDFKSAILAKSPHFAQTNQKIFDALANKLQRQGQYSQFGPLYELFIYSFFIGIHINSRIPLPDRKYTTDFAKIGAWKRDSPIVSFILLTVFSKSEEIGFDWNDLEQMNERDLEGTLKNIVTFIEEYAHGGLNYLKVKYDNDELDNSQYLFVDVLEEVIDLLEPGLQAHLEENTEIVLSEESKNLLALSNLIANGEGTTLEFKSTLRVNLHTSKPDKLMEHACMKTLAGFANTNGGTLLIGIKDDKTVMGIETDFATFKSDKDVLDEFQKHLDNLIEQYFDNSFFSMLDIRFHTIQDLTVCEIEVKQSKKGWVILHNKSDGNKEEFYIRRVASTKALSLTDMNNYIKSHWG